MATPVLRREELPVGTAIAGPAIIEQMDSTVVVPPWASGTTDALGNVVLNAARPAQIA
jgi:N-methylhydantoinase A/oxoprolinase/acetone carboxylase beta subunit